jgi:hypothetical protein
MIERAIATRKVRKTASRKEKAVNKRVKVVHLEMLTQTAQRDDFICRFWALRHGDEGEVYSKFFLTSTPAS